MFFNKDNKACLIKTKYSYFLSKKISNSTSYKVSQICRVYMKSKQRGCSQEKIQNVHVSWSCICKWPLLQLWLMAAKGIPKSRLWFQCFPPSHGGLGDGGWRAEAHREEASSLSLPGNPSSPLLPVPSFSFPCLSRPLICVFLCLCMHPRMRGLWSVGRGIKGNSIARSTSLVFTTCAIFSAPLFPTGNPISLVFLSSDFSVTVRIELIHVLWGILFVDEVRSCDFGF